MRERSAAARRDRHFSAEKSGQRLRDLQFRQIDRRRLDDVAELVRLRIQLTLGRDRPGRRGDVDVVRFDLALRENDVGGRHVDGLAEECSFANRDRARAFEFRFRSFEMQGAGQLAGDWKRAEVEEGDDVGDGKLSRGDVEIERRRSFAGMPADDAVETQFRGLLSGHQQVDERRFSFLRRSGDDDFIADGRGRDVSDHFLDHLPALAVVRL